MKLTINLIAILISIVFATSCVAQDELPQDELNRFTREYAEIGLFRGVIAVKLGDEEWISAYGTASEVWGIPNDPDTKISLASVSKVLTATLILSLVDDGMLDLDAPVGTYLPELAPEIGEAVSLRQLLSHTSGLKREVHADGQQYLLDLSNDELIAAISENGLVAVPGESRRYSNAGLVLSRIIAEEVTGRNFGMLLQNHIFDPAGMTGSGVYSHAEIVEHLADGHSVVGPYVGRANPENVTSNLGAAGLYTTAQDLFAFHDALSNRTILSEDISQLILTPHVPGHSLGWRVSPAGVDEEGNELYAMYHAGDTAGITTYFLRNESEDLVIAILGNQGRLPRSELLNGIIAVLNGSEPEEPQRNYANDVFTAMLTEGEDAAREAMRNAEEMLGERPMHGAHILMAGNTLLRMNRIEEAGEIFRLGTLFFSNDTYVWLGYGTWHQSYGDRAIARQSYERVLEMVPGDPMATHFLEELDSLE